MAKIKVTFMSYDLSNYGSVEEARADGALREFEKDMHDMSHIGMYAENLLEGMKMNASVYGLYQPLLIVQIRL